MARQHMTIPIFVPHQGCPHRCLFCNQWVTGGAKKIPDREAVLRTVEKYRSSSEPGREIELAFFGGSFTAIDRGIQEELLAAALEQKRKGLIGGIRLSTRPDCISDAALDLLARFEVDTVELGAQSFHDEVLNAAGRGHSAGDTVVAAKMIKSRGMGLVIQLMPGLPLDSAEKSMSSARSAADLYPDAVRIYPTVVVECTGLEKLWRQGKYRPLSLEDAVSLCAGMYGVFSDKNIPVIRIGLHPLAPEEARSVLAGPYHTAFGFMVKSRARRSVMGKALRKFLEGGCGRAGGRITAHLPARDIEEYIGHRRENIRYLEKIAGRGGILHEVSESDMVYFSETGGL